MQRATERVAIRTFEPRPAQIIFANSGVRLTAEGSDLIDDLRALEESGVEVISCGTCLDYYGLVEKLRVGRTSNMYEIASALVGADRVVRPRGVYRPAAGMYEAVSL